MFRYSLRHSLYAIAVSAACLAPALASAGGIALGGTRIVYPANTKQLSMSVRNSSDESNFLVQSWVEKEDGTKSQDFVVTPPLYVSGPGNENTLRIMYVGQPARTDQETLYYFNTKAIPSMDKDKMAGKNILMVAAVTRIKMFLRPDNLTPTVDKAPAELTFYQHGGQMRIDNPTPYYLTLAEIKVGDKALPDTMVSPHGMVEIPYAKASSAHTITYRTINDFGAVTPAQHADIAMN